MNEAVQQFMRVIFFSCRILKPRGIYHLLMDAQTFKEPAYLSLSSS